MSKKEWLKTETCARAFRIRLINKLWPPYCDYDWNWKHWNHPNHKGREFKTWKHSRKTQYKMIKRTHVL